MSCTPTDLHVRDWAEAKRILNDRADKSWVFRGQRRASWTLGTSLDRNKSLFDRDVTERVAIKQFRRGAHHYLASTPPLADPQPWLALMQHDGVPTRLLDWTHSPNVAAYFAFEEAFPDEEDACAIWMLNLGRCRVSGVRAI